jgi:hypothetical protein
VGQKGRAIFNFYLGASEPFPHAIAAGGAATTVSFFISPPASAVVTSGTSDASVLVVGPVQDAMTGSRCSQAGTMAVTSGQIGSADLILSDGDGAEVDRITLTMAPTTQLKIDQGWTDPAGPQILTGTVQGIHATTIGADATTLVGVGAVKFTLSSSLSAVSNPQELPLLFGGDVVTFRADSPGPATVDADCPIAHAEVPLTAVDPSQLDALVLTLGSKDTSGQWVNVSATAGGKPVWGVECAWSSQPAGLKAGFLPSFIGGAPINGYELIGKSGSYDATCAIPGGPSQTITVQL